MTACATIPEPSSNAYKQAVFQHLENLFAPRGRYRRALDFGSGDGWFAQQLKGAGAVREVVAIDVQRRRHEFIEPQLYDGQRLPFPDRSFDLVYAVDVLHHCPDPAAGLQEMLRVSRGDVVLKDHTFENPAGRILLALMDELGNRRFGVPSLYRYQRGWEWLPAFAAAGFRQVELRHPLACDPRVPWRWWTPRLQFLGLWERGA
ncbi:MAG: methyltransferase domain-containing protein [bacterium]|nr:methyltransferase domain-containing protein [bacterium]